MVSKRISIYWENDDEWYDGKISSFNSSGKTHQVLYDDGEVEELNLSEQKVRSAQSFFNAQSLF
jgi:hypothetical protein